MKTIRAEDIPADAWEFLESLDLSREDVVVERGGQPKVVLSSARAMELRQQAKQSLFELIDRIRQRNARKDADEILAELENEDHAARNGV